MYITAYTEREHSDTSWMRAKCQLVNKKVRTCSSNKALKSVVCSLYRSNRFEKDKVFKIRNSFEIIPATHDHYSLLMCFIFE